MTFSGDFNSGELIRFVRQELKKMGFLLNEQKTKIQRAGSQQSVTGIVVNEKSNVSATYRRKLQQELYYCRKFGVAEHLRKIGLEVTEETYLQHLLGKVNYVLQICPSDAEWIHAQKWLFDKLKSV